MSRIVRAAIFIPVWLLLLLFPQIGKAEPRRSDAKRGAVAEAPASTDADSCGARYRRERAEEKMALTEGDQDRALEAVLRATREFHSCAPADPAPREVENEIAA